MNMLVYLGLSMLSKTATYRFWFNNINRKYGEKEKLCYMDTDSFIVHVKTENVYGDIAKDVEKRFDT